MTHLWAPMPGPFSPAGMLSLSGQACPTGSVDTEQGLGAGPWASKLKTSRYRSWPSPFNQAGALGQSGQGPVHAHSRLAAALPLPVPPSGPPGGNSLRLSVRRGSILIADTQHDCQAFSHSVLNPLCGGVAAGTLGLSTVTAARRLHHSACPVPCSLLRGAVCLMNVILLSARGPGKSVTGCQAGSVT